MTESKQHQALIDGTPPAEGAGIFGSESNEAESELVLIPVPFDATASYGSGAEHGPESILQASHQLDLEDLTYGKPYLKGITYSDELTSQIVQKNEAAKFEIKKSQIDFKKVNSLCSEVNDLVYQKSKILLQQSKIVAVVGGDHSSPYGLIKAIAERYDEFGILHLDAHFDLRSSYEGYDWSHASIMFNCLRDFSNISKICHVGIRDFSFQEKIFQQTLSDRSKVAYSEQIFERQSHGEPFIKIVDEWISHLPQNIYLSFDIDGLEPSLCPNTGTPVPGGFSFEQTSLLIRRIAFHGKKVIGFDLCEVASVLSPDDKGGFENEWDGNVGARLLYKLCGSAIYSKFSYVDL